MGHRVWVRKRTAPSHLAAATNSSFGMKVAGLDLHAGVEASLSVEGVLGAASRHENEARQNDANAGAWVADGGDYRGNA